MPYAFKNNDEKCDFLCVCLKSALANGGKVNVESVADTLNFAPGKVSVFLNLVKKSADAIVKNGGNGASAEPTDDTNASEDAGKTKKRKLPDITEAKEDQVPESKKARVTVEIKKSKGVGKVSEAA